MSDFFAMGGYAAYVWPAYVISLGALLAIGIASWRRLKRYERLVEISDAADHQS